MQVLQNSRLYNKEHILTNNQNLWLSALQILALEPHSSGCRAWVPEDEQEVQPLPVGEMHYVGVACLGKEGFSILMKEVANCLLEEMRWAIVMVQTFFLKTLVKRMEQRL